jgi:hypothetical protein
MGYSCVEFRAASRTLLKSLGRRWSVGATAAFYANLVPLSTLLSRASVIWSLTFLQDLASYGNFFRHACSKKLTENYRTSRKVKQKKSIANVLADDS